jgi:crotonobetainyl-CoA:carnitine CoA-transferase CaiB-like acyl-CoA transferase
VLALLDRERTGEGQWVTTSLIEAQIYMLDFQAARYLMKGEVPGQEGNFHPTGVGTGTFQTSDGYINIAAAGEMVWKRFCDASGLVEFYTHPDYAAPAERSKNRRKVLDRMVEVIREKPSQYWIDLCDKAGVPCGPINTIDKVFAEPQVQHLGIATPIDHPKYGAQKVVGQPIHLSSYRQPEKLKHTPEPGEHTDEVLKSLGYDDERIAALREKRVV